MSFSLRYYGLSISRQPLFECKGKNSRYEWFLSDLEIIFKKYPNAILTGEYAFNCHNLTDVILEKYYIATKAKALQYQFKNQILQALILGGVRNDNRTMIFWG